MNYIIEICVAIDIAILGIAYPILVDKITNIGAKYNSEYLPNVFDSEFPQNKIIKKLSVFQIILFLTVSSFIFKILSFQPLEYFKNNFLLENSADILILILTISLTFCFFYWLSKIMLYQGKASELLKYLINKYNNQKENNQSKTYILKTINEFAIYSIEKQDIHLQASLIDFYSNLFLYYKEKANKNDGPVYPNDLYNILNEIISTSIDNNNKKLKTIERRASSGIWLIGENYNYNKISETTYNWLWANIVTSSKHKELISNYWLSASQYFSYSLSLIWPEYDGLNITNQAEIDKINKERERFLELNFALGGLLYYENNFCTLKYILTFSQSQPPSYPLLPQTMDEIFYWFNYFSNEFKHFENPIDHKYYFPGIDNLGISSNVNHNICLYISLLFIRQFTQHTIFVYQNFKIFHNLTNDLQELYSYNDRLLYFKNCIEKIIANKELMKTLEYNIEREIVIETFDDLKNQIRNKIDLEKLTANLSTEKIQTFYDSSKKNIINAFKEYKSIENEIDFTNIDKKMITSITGELIISSKSSFTDNDIPNINFDSIYSQSIAKNKIKYFLPNAFLLAKTDRYLIEKKQLLEGLDKILTNLKDKIIILINPDYESQQLIFSSKYKDIIVRIPATNRYLTNTYFILDKKDLPKFESKELSKNEIDKFKLEIIDKDYKLYSNIIDINLHENHSLKKEYITNDNDTELKVLVVIAFIFLIKWTKSRKIIMLSLSSPFEEKGILNDIEELKPL